MALLSHCFNLFSLISTSSPRYSRGHKFPEVFPRSHNLHSGVSTLLLLTIYIKKKKIMTLVLRLIMNDGFSFDFSIPCSEFFRVSWVNRC